MGTVETFDHTADVGLRVVASDLADLFRTSAEAVLDYIVANRGDVRPSESVSLTLAADDPADLLVLWLNELIFRVETTHRLFGSFEVRVLDDGRRLEATVFGEPIDMDRHVLDHEVKAVTQHALKVGQEGADWVAELILDI